MKRVLALALALGLGATVHAQSTFFVDPAAGSDSNGGASAGDAFRSLTHALTVAAPGDEILCLAGTYSADETFPIGVRSGIRIASHLGTPVFDGQGAPVLFTVAENVTEETEISGLDLTDADVLFRLSNRSSQGLRLTGCSFSDATDAFEAAFASNAGAQELTVNGCIFAATAGDEAVFVAVGVGTTLQGGGITGNQILGVFGTGISLSISASGAITSGFNVERNVIGGCATGIAVVAQGSGGNPLNEAVVAADFDANDLSGSGGVGTVGIELIAAVGVVGEDASIASWFRYNVVENFATAVLCASTNDNNGVADVVPEFFGNVLRGDGTGVRLTATLPNPINRNADPNFGGNPEGDASGFNTFEGFTTDFDLAANLSQIQYASFNWFDGSPVSQDGVLRTEPVNDDPLEADDVGNVRAESAGEELTITAGNNSGFVDFPGPGSIGQIEVEVDGVALDQSDLEVSDFGLLLTLTLPALASGEHTVTVTNPGGQSGEFDFLAVVAGEGSEGCFVATAAHGNYDAPEVLRLRALRDEYLLTNAPGRSFVRWYYREGPQAAAWIAERPWARASARVALQPAVWTAHALTRWNAAERFACALFALGAAFALLRRRA